MALLYANVLYYRSASRSLTHCRPIPYPFRGGQACVTRCRENARQPPPPPPPPQPSRALTQPPPPAVTHWPIGRTSRRSFPSSFVCPSHSWRSSARVCAHRHSYSGVYIVVRPSRLVNRLRQTPHVTCASDDSPPTPTHHHHGYYTRTLGFLTLPP